jgi:hypothetical protein
MIGLRKFLVALVLVCSLLVTSCTQAPPSRFEGAQQNSTSRGATAVVKESESGSSFNRYFPKPGNGYEVTYSQEKKGFAQAKLKKDGKEVASLAVSDTLNNPSSTDKFQNSTEKIKGYPVISQGTTGTAVLVSNRYQVKILSRDPAFTESDRQEWLNKFDLNGLSRVK